MEVLHEIYFGKQSSLLKLEDLITKMRAKYSRSDVLGNAEVFRQVIKDPINKLIGDTIAKQFGFIEVLFTYSNQKKYNAYTIPLTVDKQGNVYDMDENKIDYNKYMKKSIIVNNKGIMYDTNVFKTNLMICINTGLFFSNVVTVPQIVSVLLHEIGHVFTRTMIEYNILNDRMDEKFADQFVAMYGYAPEYTKVMDLFYVPKYGNIEEKFVDVPIVNLFIGVRKVWKYFKNRSLGDEHPAVLTRMQSQIKQLESDLKNTPNLTPTMRKSMQNQIDECKKIIDKAFTYGNNTPSKIIHYFHSKYEPNMDLEKRVEKYSDKYSNPDVINKRLRKLYKAKGRRR